MGDSLERVEYTSNEPVGTGESLGYLGHVLMENRHGLKAGAMIHFEKLMGLPAPCTPGAYVTGGTRRSEEVVLSVRGYSPPTPPTRIPPCRPHHTVRDRRAVVSTGLLAPV
jgi:hypothetical protein